MVSRNHFSQREVCHKSQERKKKVIAVKEVRSKEVDGSSASIGLLVSILVRYPEICTVSYTPDAKMLGFSFMVSRRLEDDEVEGFRSSVLDSISVYLDLLKFGETPTVEVCAVYLGSITQIQVTRDVATLTGDEISLLIGLIIDAFDDDLVTDRSEDLEEEEMIVQEEFIANLLVDLKETTQEKRLIGFREGGRVIVYNRPA